MRKYRKYRTEAQLRNAQAEIKRQLEENGELKSCMFCIHNLSGDESISFTPGSSIHGLECLQCSSLVAKRNTAINI